MMVLWSSSVGFSSLMWGLYLGGKSQGKKKIPKKVGDWESQRYFVMIAGDGLCHLGTILKFTPSTLAHRHLLRTQVSDECLGRRCFLIDGHPRWSSGFNVHSGVGSDHHGVGFLVTVFGWFMEFRSLWGGGVQIIDPEDASNGVHVKHVPKIRGLLWLVHVEPRPYQHVLFNLAAFTKSNGDDFRWSKRKPLLSHRYSPMCSCEIGTSKSSGGGAIPGGYPPKTNTTMEHQPWMKMYISYWKWRCSIVRLVFGGVHHHFKIHQVMYLWRDPNFDAARVFFCSLPESKKNDVCFSKNCVALIFMALILEGLCEGNRTDVVSHSLGVDDLIFLGQAGDTIYFEGKDPNRVLCLPELIRIPAIARIASLHRPFISVNPTLIGHNSLSFVLCQAARWKGTRNAIAEMDLSKKGLQICMGDDNWLCWTSWNLSWSSRAHGRMEKWPKSEP